MKVLKVILGFVAVLVILAVGAAGYLGYIPVLSGVFGTNKAQDLGVTYTEADFASAKTKFGVDLAVLPAGSTDSISYEGSHEVKTSFTQSELTAMVNSKKYVYTPVRDVQIKINDDGTVESSGILQVDNLVSYFDSVGGGSVDTAMVAKYIGYLPGEVPYYIAAKPVVTGGVASLEMTNLRLGSDLVLPSLVSSVYAAANGNVSSFKAGFFTLSESQISGYQSQISAFLTARLAMINGLRMDSVTFASGEMNFAGAMPNKKSRVVE